MRMISIVQRQRLFIPFTMSSEALKPSCVDLLYIVRTISLLCCLKFSLMNNRPTAIPIFSFTYSTHFCHLPLSREVPYKGKYQGVTQSSLWWLISPTSVSGSPLQRCLKCEWLVISEVRNRTFLLMFQRDVREWIKSIVHTAAYDCTSLWNRSSYANIRLC